MAQRVVPAIKIKDVVGEPTVAIQAALQAGSIVKNPNGTPAPDQFIPLGYFVGRVSDQVEHKSNRKNPDGSENNQSWPKLVGQFKSWSVDPQRDDFVSTSAFLMDHITTHLGGVIKEARKDDPAATLEVLFEVGVTTSDKSSTGFVWTMRNMADPTVAADPLAALVAKVKGEAPAALPAPTDQTGGEPAPDAPDAPDADAETTGTGEGGDKVDAGHKHGGRRARG